MPPSAILGNLVAQSIEDDVSLIWLTDSTQTANAVQMLSKNLATIGGGEILSGNSLTTFFNSPTVDSRSPDIVVVPNVGTIYTGGTKKVSEHGGFAIDDTNVIMLVSNPAIPAGTWTGLVKTTQVAQTIVGALGYNVHALQSTLTEGTEVLPGFALDNSPIVLIKAQSDSPARTVVLDASGSSDPNHSPLTFSWTSTTNNAAILGANSATPTVQLQGARQSQYTFNVTVTNASAKSSTGSVTFHYVGP
jgi:hypothetical protein